MKYFTEKEIEDFKKGSINYPLMVIEKEQHEVIIVSEITNISGMSYNNGTPTSINIKVHRKGQEAELLTYTLKPLTQ